MANQIKMAKIHSILTLHERGWSNREIARELGIHRETVGRYIRLAGQEAWGGVPAGTVQSKPAKVPPGPASPKPCEGGSTVPPGGSQAVGEAHFGRSACEPLREVILAKLEQGLSGQRIWQDLVGEDGFAGSYDSVKRFVRRLGKATPLPFRRMECAAGEEAQVDFGRGAPIVWAETGRKGSHVFRIVLSHSRKGYSEAVFRQSTDGFLQALENAFWSFSGVPRTIVIDNLKAAVKKADWFDPELNPKIQAFCEHYETVILPTKPYTPRHKGKVEKGIDYVQGNALKGRTFRSLKEENRHLADWEANVADTRIHGTTRKQVGKVFREVEQAALLPLPPGRFGFFHEAQRTVHRDGHVEVDKAYYSVPPEYVGHRVWVRWDGRLVRVFTKRMEQIAVHAQHEAGRFSTQSKHIHSRKISSVERGAEWLLSRAGVIGSNAERWGKAMLEARGIQGIRVLVGLVSLANRHRSDQIDRACAVAVTHDAFRLRTIRELIKRDGAKQQAFEYLAEHEIIRDLASYDEVVAASLAGRPVATTTWDQGDAS
jgi:transposase